MSTEEEHHARTDCERNREARAPAGDLERPRAQPDWRRSSVADTPANRGMIAKVAHLVRVVEGE